MLKNLFVFRNLVYIFNIVVLAISLSACGKRPIVVPGETKDSLKYLSQSKTKKQSVSPLRVQMLRDTALSVGARGGLASRAKKINAIISKHSKLLDRNFNFYGMLLDNNVLPPVLAEGRNSLDLQASDVIRAADRHYRIIKQARFVTAPPTWREYLLLGYETPEEPDRSLLPRNSAERIIWKRYIDEGWSAGEKQAEVIFEENVAKLTRDYNGMILYKTLLAKNMVTPPYVASMDLGVTGDKNGMNINDRILRITAKPNLNTNSKEWKATVTPYE